MQKWTYVSLFQKFIDAVEVYRCITSVHGKESVGRREEGAYPYLRLLLQFDAQQVYGADVID